METRLRVGVDSGGTFTDICLYFEDRREIAVWKVPSTPHDPSEAIAGGVVQGLDDFVPRDSWRASYFGHSTTVATNAIIQRTGAKTAMFTTRGFRDVLELRRHRRPALYDIQADKPDPLISRDLRLEVSERVLFDGTEDKPLDEDEVRGAARRLKAEGITSVAVGFLFSHVDARHERRVRDILEEEIPGVFVALSHEIAGDAGEYERFSTTAMSAYVGPLIKTYIERLTPKLRSAGIDVPIYLTQSNGGIISAETAARQPVRTMLSGPAAGVTGALAVARAAGIKNFITFDMGGTSSDISLIDNGRPLLSDQADLEGHAIKLPMLDIHTVGAGGGSIARIDDGGFLKVGPASAGAYPGPACYGNGSTEATVTDANVVLQVLNPERLLGGRVKIDQAKSCDAVSRLADKLGLDVLSTAQGIVSVVTANMAKAMRVVSVERGYDPRDFTLMAFGGAGPIHAARLAKELDIPSILVPRTPGIMCALGLLLGDLRTNLSTACVVRLAPEALDFVNATFSEMEGEANTWLAGQGASITRVSISRSLDMRYVSQAHTINVPVEHGDPLSDAVRLRKKFEAVYRQVYGFTAESDAVEIISVRTDVLGEVSKVDLTRYPDATSPVSEAVTGHRDVYVPEAGKMVSVPLYDRNRLGPGHRITGPAIVDQMDSTTWVIPGQVATVDPYLNLIIKS